MTSWLVFKSAHEWLVLKRPMTLDGAFVDARENVLAFGRSGSGKTHLLCGIAQELVRSGRKVLFGPCSLLVQDLLIAKRDLN